MKKQAEHDEAMKVPPEGSGKEQSAAPEAGTTDAGQQQAAQSEKPAEPKEESAKDAGPKMPDLSVRVAELEKLNADLQDQYLRKAADFDNYRKRMIKEKQEAIDFANANLLVDLVQILDDFDRALAASGSPEPGTPQAAFTDGVTMIRKQLGGMLENKYGLAHYEVKGASFDPTVHEAIGSVPSPDVKEPTVAEEFVKGYKLKDRVIRVAKVMVSMPAEKAAQ